VILYPSVVVDVLNLYLDDSGTRHPDHRVNTPSHGHDWFSLGGVMVSDDEEGEDAVRTAHRDVCAKWEITQALHSAEIRSKSKNFRWVRNLTDDKRDEFMRDIGVLATHPKLTAIACVIDRPGYDHRYREKYGRERWLLCKTAFTVVVERAVKHARAQGAKLRVLVERSDRETDRMLRGYYDDLRKCGHPFDARNASRYEPLTADQLHETLYEFRAKEKTSPLMQVADLVLWPICIGGYDSSNRPYNMLKTAGTLIDCQLVEADIPERGIKYSCWDLQPPKNPKPDLSTGLGQPPKGDLVG
jgi:hypothetical protein